ncbi:MAG: hypothetical protein MG2_0347 [uncultured Candidatus Poseidoniales archaeon]|nr:MAG: hypothetical protein MG2_0347 [uncultured Candidatus Poseidoniales archaeon]
MHIASKITLILGALIFVGSIAGVVIAGMALSDAGFKEEVYVDRSMSQTFTIQENKSWDVSIYVIHPADCDTLELSIVDSDGEEVVPVLCLLDGGQGNEEFYPDGSEEFYGSLNHDIEGMEYTLESNVEVSIRGDYCDPCAKKQLAEVSLPEPVASLGSAALSLSLFSASFLPWFLTTPSKTS